MVEKSKPGVEPAATIVPALSVLVSTTLVPGFWPYHAYCICVPSPSCKTTSGPSFPMAAPGAVNVTFNCSVLFESLLALVAAQPSPNPVPVICMFVGVETWLLQPPEIFSVVLSNELTTAHTPVAPPLLAPIVAERSFNERV